MSAARLQRIARFAALLDQGLTVEEAGEQMGVAPRTAELYEREGRHLREAGIMTPTDLQWPEDPHHRHALRRRWIVGCLPPLDRPARHRRNGPAIHRRRRRRHQTHVGEDEDTLRFVRDAAADLGAPLMARCTAPDIWDVFREKRWLGNTSLAHCSWELKTKPARGWIEANAPECERVIFGIDSTEIHRMAAIARRGSPTRPWPH